jgi:hypothetical protein
MARVVEILTINLAVSSLDEAIPRLQALGIDHVPPAHMPEPPAEIIDVSFPFSGGGALSLIQATAPTSPVARFLERRPEGPYSVALRVDDLREAMREWGERGIEWVLEEPTVFEDGEAAGTRVERLLMNWIKPRSLPIGIAVEVCQFEGRTERHDGHG